MLFNHFFDANKNRQLFILATPMILSNITVPLLGLVDTAVIGHLDEAYYLGGVALGSTMITLIIWLLGFLRMSTTGLVAQAFGAQDQQAQLKTLIQGCTFALLLSFIVLLLHRPLFDFALSLTSASEQVLFYCRQYIAIRIWSLPFALLNLVMLGWLLGRQAPKAAMWQLIIANSINIVLDILFVFVFKLGVQGAALASVIADISAFCVALIMVRGQLTQDAFIKPIQWINKAMFHGCSRLLMLNRDIFIRSLCLQAAFSFITFYGAGLGDNTIAANAVLLNLLLLISYALDGIAYYAEAEVGRAYGKQDKQLMLDSVNLAFSWSLIIALLFSLIFLVFGQNIINLLTNLDDVRQTAAQYLLWIVLMPLVSFGCYLFDGVYIGAAAGRVMRNSMIISTFGVFFPLWYVLKSYDNHALWAAMAGFMFCRSMSLMWHYHTRLKNQF